MDRDLELNTYKFLDECFSKDYNLDKMQVHKNVSELINDENYKEIYNLLKHYALKYKINNKIIDALELIANECVYSYCENIIPFDDLNIKAIASKFNESTPSMQTIKINTVMNYEQVKDTISKVMYYKWKSDGAVILPYILSENMTISGRVISKTSMPTKYTLLSARKVNNSLEINYLGDSIHKPSAERYTQKLYSYFFVSEQLDPKNKTISEGGEYTLLSPNPLPLENGVIKGMLIPLNDTLRIGNKASIQKNANIIYVTDFRESIKRIDDNEFKQIIIKYKDNYERLYADYFGKFRHPKIFERFLLGWLFASECSYGPLQSYKPNLGIIGKSRGGKSVILNCLSRVFRESKEGETSTIKSFVPSFGSKDRPSPGTFLKAHRFCLAEEFLSTVSKAIKRDSSEDLDLFKSMLVHDETRATSGKFDGASLSAKPTATFVFVSNFLTTKVTDFVSMAKYIAPSFLSRFIIYVQPKEHYDFVKENANRLSRDKESSDDDFYPSINYDKISLYDYLLKKKVAFSGFDEFDIIKSVKHLLPADDSAREVHNAANEHLVRLIDGITKLNYITEGRTGKITVTKKDFDDAKDIWTYIISTWQGDITKLPLKYKIELLTKMQKDIYDVVEEQECITKKDLEVILKTPVGFELNKMCLSGVLEQQDKIGDKYYMINYDSNTK